MATAQGETFLNYKVGYRYVVSQNEIHWVFKRFDKFQTASPFSRVQINTELNTSRSFHVLLETVIISEIMV